MSWTTLSAPVPAKSSIYKVGPLPPTGSTSDVDFMWDFTSTGFWYFTTATAVQYKSRITNGP
jgi:hypothetical protein